MAEQNVLACSVLEIRQSVVTSSRAWLWPVQTRRYMPSVVSTAARRVAMTWLALNTGVDEPRARSLRSAVWLAANARLDVIADPFDLVHESGLLQKGEKGRECPLPYSKFLDPRLVYGKEDKASQATGHGPQDRHEPYLILALRVVFYAAYCALQVVNSLTVFIPCV